MKIIVSLTTIPSRLQYLETCINSLKGQTVAPDKIMIHIPRLYSRFQTGIEASQIHSSCLPYVFYLDHDYGPGTKLMGCISQLSSSQLQESLLVLVDDDQIYHPYFLEDLGKYFTSGPKQPSAASYRTYTISVNKQKMNIGCGFSGFAMPGKYLERGTLLKYFQFLMDKNSLFFFHDDLWISYYLNLIGINIIRIRYKKLGFGGKPRRTNHSLDSENLHHALKHLTGVLSRKNVRKRCLRCLKKNHHHIIQLLARLAVEEGKVSME